MKKLMMIVTCGMLLLAAGCKKDEPTPGTQPAASFTANIARPTWSASKDYDYSSSMTAVIRVDLKAQYPDKAADWQLNEQDLLAAFSGETCLGTASPKDGVFYLYVAGTNDNSVTLRYYSTQYKNLFEAADAFPFENDVHLGTVAEPLTPSFVVAK